MDNSPKYLFKIGQLEASLQDLAYDDIFLKERDPKKREQYIKNIIDTSTKSAEDYARRINLKENTMKKSELKELLKVIAEEVIAAKKLKMDETKGMSGFKKSKESTEHTEKVADSKSLTPTTEPKEKEEGKKLPVVKKPANPQKVGSIKEEILQMIREEIDEMARTAGSIGSKYKVEDPNSPTGWVVKGHKTIPDGTPTEAPKGPYVPKGTNPNMGRPKSTPVLTGPASPAEIARTEDAVEEFIKYNPNATEQEIADALAEKNSEETPLSLDATVIQNAIQKARAETTADAEAGEPDVEKLAASEKAAKIAKINKLRAYLMKKKGLKK